MPKTRTTWTVNPAVKFALTPESAAPEATAELAASQEPTQADAAQAEQAAAAQAAADAARAVQEAHMISESFETLRTTLISAQSKNDQQLAQTESAIEETNLKIKETQDALFKLEHPPVSATQPQLNMPQPPAPPVPQPQMQPVQQPQMQPVPQVQTQPMPQVPAGPQPQVPAPAAPQAPAPMAAAPMVAAPMVAAPMVAWGGQLPLRPQADIYVWPDGSITYLNNMLAYFQRKGLSVMYYSPGFSYQPQDIIMLPFAPQPVPSNFTLVLDNNKRRTWEFLKQAFAARGIAI